MSTIKAKEIVTAVNVHENDDKDSVEDVKQQHNSKNHNKYRRDKPWDNDGIEHWKVQSWDEEKGDRLLGGSLLEESSFATLFPKYRERYLREVWPVVSKALDRHKIACELNLGECVELFSYDKGNCYQDDVFDAPNMKISLKLCMRGI